MGRFYKREMQFLWEIIKKSFEKINRPGSPGRFCDRMDQGVSSLSLQKAMEKTYTMPMIGAKTFPIMEAMMPKMMS